MSRYFFHIRDGLIFVPDEEGMDCRTSEAVEDEVTASTKDLARGAIHSRPYAIPPTIEVQDEDGNAVVVAGKPWLH